MTNLGHPSYSVYVSDPFGVRLGDASNFVSLKYSRAVNNVATAYVTLPESFNQSLLRIPDGRLEIWRRLDSGREYLDTETIWLIKAVEYRRNAQGQRVLVVEADTPLSIIDNPGRIVRAWAGSTDAVYTNVPADNAIVNLVFAALNGTFRDVDYTQYVTFAPRQGLGATVSKAFSWRNVLKVAQEFAEASTQQGVYVAFDIVAPTPTTLEFRTYAGQRGVDHRFPAGQNPVLLSPDFGNLGETTLRYDYRDMASYVYIGGKGEGTSRVVASVYDQTLWNISPFGHREIFIEYNNSADLTILKQEGYADLRSRRPRTTFRGKIISTSDTQYGVHWGWGDYVTAQDFGQSFDCRIDAITVTVENGQETVDAWLRGETS